jgi:hypothetical protein
MVGPILFLSFLFFLKNFDLDFENKFLLIFSTPIILIVLTESVLVRANANWAAPALISVFILLFRLVNDKNIKLIKINYIFNYCVAVLLFSSIMFSSNIKVFDRINGVNSFVQEISSIIGDKDLAVSNRIIFSSISYGFKGGKNNVYMPHQKNTPITNHFQMTSFLDNNQKKDFYFIGELSDISYLTNKYQEKFIKEFNVSFISSKLNLYEIIFK